MVAGLAGDASEIDVITEANINNILVSGSNITVTVDGDIIAKGYFVSKTEYILTEKMGQPCNIRCVKIS